MYEVTKGKEDEVQCDQQISKDLDQTLKNLQLMPASRERALAITKLQESIMWIDMDLKRLNEQSANPQPPPNAT